MADNEKAGESGPARIAAGTQDQPGDRHLAGVGCWRRSRLCWSTSSCVRPPLAASGVGRDHRLCHGRRRHLGHCLHPARTRPCPDRLSAAGLPRGAGGCSTSSPIATLRIALVVRSSAGPSSPRRCPHSHANTPLATPLVDPAASGSPAGCGSRHRHRCASRLPSYPAPPGGEWDSVRAIAGGGIGTGELDDLVRRVRPARSAGLSIPVGVVLFLLGFGIDSSSRPSR